MAEQGESQQPDKAVAGSSSRELAARPSGELDVAQPAPGASGTGLSGTGAGPNAAAGGGGPAAGSPTPSGAGGAGGSSAAAGGAKAPSGGGQMAAGAATSAIDAKIAGDGSSATRRYTGKAVAGGVEGGLQGGLQGAAAGAGKGVAQQAAMDAGGKAAETMGSQGSSSGGGIGSGLLGVGGTSLVQGKDGDDRAVKLAGSTGVAAAGAPVAGALSLVALMNWLKSMFFSLAAMGLNILAALWGLAVGAVKSVAGAIASPFMALGSAAASTAGAVLGVSVSAAAAPAVAIVSGITVGGLSVSLLGGFISGLDGRNELLEGNIAAPGNCAVIGPALAGEAGEVGDISAQTEKNAKITYSVLSSWGMPDENIAGILGNWVRESGIDPTSVEGIFHEPFFYGPSKQAAEASGFSHMGYVPISGIGLGQWTNERNTLLINYANAKNRPWYEIETQLAFMAQGDNEFDRNNFRSMLNESKGSPGQAAMWFHDNWERSADDATGHAARMAQAELWFAKLSTWEVDQLAVDRIKELAGDILGEGESVVAAINTACSQQGGSGSGAWDDRDGQTKPGEWGGYGNGKIPAAELTAVSWSPGDVLRGDAAADLERLNDAYKAKFGTNISITDSYRSYEEQVRIKAEKGVWAATPGYSNHGWAMALDLGGGINSFGTAQHEWMKDNAPAYGWVHPPWAGVNGSLPEAWHWEYWGYPS